MKSDANILEQRGYIEEGSEEAHLHMEIHACIDLLKNPVPHQRTLGARLIARKHAVIAIPDLIAALKIEDMLYSKLGICEALISLGTTSISPLIDILGKIGDNQHTEVPEEVFKKDSYPLPRDIAARTLIRFGKDAISPLMEVLQQDNIQKISEAIDALGYISFYEKMPHLYSPLEDCYNRFADNNLIKWKIVQAMAGFKESVEFLKKEKQSLSNERLIAEIDRSLKLIENA
jgi:hypothetical protein